MPELPEVETVVRGLRAAGLVGRTITSAHVYWPRIIANLTPHACRSRIRGLRIEGVRRRAKYIVVDLSGEQVLLIHLRMTGQLSLTPTTQPRKPHQHIVLDLDDGRSLRYKDTRKFGRWHLVHDPGPILNRLGPEPLARAFSADAFVSLLKTRKGKLKPLLLNQDIIAGLGNIYVDEALFDAGLHPEKACNTLSETQLRKLYCSIRKVLRRGIRTGGTTLGSGQTNFYSVAGRRGRNQDGLRVFRRDGEACPTCGAVIQRLIVGQRSTHVCPRCQVG